MDELDWYTADRATLGDRIAAARDAVGLTQEELAARLGVKFKTLISWEEDRQEPRANRVSMMSGILGVSIPWLITGSGPGAPVVANADLRAELVSLRKAALGLADRIERLEARLGDEDV
ncbi:MAG: helix-turn-helix domain-containing protein [Shimia sp.]